LINEEVEGIPWLVTVGGLVDAPVDAVFPVITDFDNYPEFMPQTEAVESASLEENISLVTYHLKINAGFIPIRTAYSNYSYHRPPERIDWTLASGEFESLYGFWELVPVEGGARTIILYTVYSQPRQSVLKWLFKEEPALEWMINVSSGAMVVNAVKGRAEKLNQKSSTESPIEDVQKRDIDKILSEDGPRLASLCKRGKMVLLEKKEYINSTAMIIIDMPRDEVWHGLKQVEDFYGSTPNMGAEILKQDEKSMTVKHRLTLNFIVVGIDFDYILKYALEPPSYMSWETVGGDLEDFTGFWRVIPLEDGQKSLLVYHGGSNMESLGYLIRYLLNMEPTFKLAIESSYALSRVSGFKDWTTVKTVKDSD
jgi:ribosome-associated toxin RatA of RatAB toxin-antitoxin module